MLYVEVEYGTTFFSQNLYILVLHLIAMVVVLLDYSYIAMVVVLLDYIVREPSRHSSCLVLIVSSSRDTKQSALKRPSAHE